MANSKTLYEILEKIQSVYYTSGYSQQELADKLKWSQSKVNRFVNGKDKKMSIMDIEEYATVFNVSLEYFVVKENKNEK